MVQLLAQGRATFTVTECLRVLPSQVWDIFRDGGDSTSVVPALWSAVPGGTPTPRAGWAIRWRGQGCRCALACHKLQCCDTSLPFCTGVIPSKQGDFPWAGISTSTATSGWGRPLNHHGSGPRPSSWAVSNTRSRNLLSPKCWPCFCLPKGHVWVQVGSGHNKLTASSADPHLDPLVFVKVE